MAGQQVLREYLLSLGFKINTDSSKKFSGVLVGVTKQATAAGAAVYSLAGTVATMATAYASSMEKLYYASRRSGSSVKQLQALRYAGEQVGISGDTMTGAIEGMAKALRGNPGLAGMLKQMGIKVEGRTSAQIMLDAVEAFRKMPFFQGKSFAAMFGLDEETFQMMSQNLDQIREGAARYQRQMDAAGVDADKNAKDMVEWKNATRDLGAAFEGVEHIIAKNITPAVHHLAEYTRNELVPALDQAFQAANRQMNESKGTGGKGFFDAVTRVLENMGLVAVGGGVKLTDDAARRARGEQQSIPQSLADQERKRVIRMLTGRSENQVNSQFAGLGRGFVNPALAAPSGGANTASGLSGSAQEVLRALERQYGLPAGLLDSVWNAESRRGTQMLSKKGAKGHFQFMPATAAEYGIAGQEGDFAVSAQAAAKKYAGLLRRYGGNVAKAAAAYNWGEGNFGRVGENLGASPAETQAYAAKVAGGITQTNTFNITATDPKAVTGAVKTALDQSNGNALRQMKTVTQ